jgi:hypothetical protein
LDEYSILWFREQDVTEDVQAAFSRDGCCPRGALGVALFEKPSARRLRMSGESMKATEST